MGLENIGGVALIIGAVLIVVLLLTWTFSRSRQLLEQWAAAHGYQIVSAEYRWFLRGPFFWTSSKGQTVYRITVVNADGYRRSAWARCGGFWWGLWTDKVDVRWDDE